MSASSNTTLPHSPKESIENINTILAMQSPNMPASQKVFLAINAEMAGILAYLDGTTIVETFG